MKHFLSIAEARKFHGLTQEGLAQIIGVTRGAVAQWEMQGGTRPDPTHAVRIAQALPGLTLDAIYGLAA